MRNPKSTFFCLLQLLLFLVILPAQEARPDALLLWRQGQYQAAVNATLQEIADNPQNLDSYTVLGWSLLDLRRWSEARDYALRALEISRYDYRIVGILGHALFQLGQNQQALQYFQEYVQLQPQGSRIDQIYSLMAEVYIRFGEFHRADIAYSTAVHHNPRIAAWWVRLGFAREQAGNLEGARTAYQGALNLQPANADALQGIQRLSNPR